MKAKVIIVIALIIVCAITSCANNPSEPTIETNHARNQIFDITFAGCAKSDKGINALGTMDTASPGNVFQVLTFKVKSLSNSVEYFNFITDNVSLVLSNGHKYTGCFTSYKFMPEASDTIEIYFETIETENVNGAMVSFSWGYSDASRCTMTLDYVEPSIKPSDVSGMYVLCNPTNGVFIGHCCIKHDGKYWQVIDGIQSEGTWVFLGGYDINIILSGEQSTVCVLGRLISDQTPVLTLKNTASIFAVKLSANENYHYGIYEGTDLQINNTVVGTWLNYERGIGIIFYSDKSLGLCSYNQDTDSWDLALGSTWSYSDGKISILYSFGEEVSFHVASAYRELYLDRNSFTKYQ